jgi:predicted outer membrane repeat protein
MEAAFNTLTMTDCTVNGNTNNCTIRGNTATGDGGGLLTGGRTPPAERSAAP